MDDRKSKEGNNLNDIVTEAHLHDWTASWKHKGNKELDHPYGGHWDHWCTDCGKCSMPHCQRLRQVCAVLDEFDVDYDKVVKLAKQTPATGEPGPVPAAPAAGNANTALALLETFLPAPPAGMDLAPAAGAADTALALLAAPPADVELAPPWIGVEAVPATAAPAAGHAGGAGDAGAAGPADTWQLDRTNAAQPLALPVYTGIPTAPALDGPPPPLPAAQHANRLLAMIHAQPVVMVQGATGCGKSTALPPIIQAEFGRTAVLQPKRGAAAGVQAKLAEGMRPGAVGLRTGRDGGQQTGTMCAGSDIMVATPMCLVLMLTQKDKDKPPLLKDKLDAFAKFKVYIVDEVHELDWPAQLLLFTLRERCRQFADERPNEECPKLVLMSATMNPSRYAAYWGIPQDIPEADYCIQVGAQRLYDVEEIFLDSQSMDAHVCFDELRNLLERGNKFTRSLQNTLAKAVCNTIKLIANIGQTIIVFLPGYAQIQQVHALLHDLNVAPKSETRAAPPCSRS